MITKQIIYFGKTTIVGCDGKCNKAWGINSRPKIQFDENNPDDYAFLADDELGEAPIDPGTYEGGCAKPQTPLELLNKWCVRECERCSINQIGTKPIAENLKKRDFSKRRYNITSREPTE